MSSNRTEVIGGGRLAGGQHFSSGALYLMLQNGVVTLLNLMRVRRVSQLKSCGGNDFAPRLHG